MTDAMINPGPRPSRRLLVWGLCLSIALNLAGAGLLVGAALRGRDGGESRGGSIARVLRDGDAAERSRARAVMEAGRPLFEARRADHRAARAAVREAALADPLDRAALGLALERLRQAETALAQARHATFEELAAGIGPERRAALVGRLEKMLAGGRGDPHGR